MHETPDIAEITSLLRQAVAGTYRPPPGTQTSDPDLREFHRVLDLLVAQKQDLMAHYAEDLKRSETRLRQIIESTPVGICITNSAGYFEYVNPTYCRLYGYENAELIGRHFTIVVPPSHRDRLTRLHAEFMGRRYELRGEWEVIRKDGSLMSIIADAAYIIDIDGEPKKVTFILDISERKRGERLLRETVERLHEEIRRREELEKVRVRVERMVRHDLRNPLNAVVAAAELLMTDELSADQRELCLMIRESGRKLDTMLSSGMDLIRMEDGTYVPDPRTVDLITILQEVRIELDALASSLGVAVRLLVNGEPPGRSTSLPLEGERLHLANAFSNLLRNAVEASSAGESVTVDVEAGEGYAVRIHNSGVVPEEIRDVFFDRYTTSGKKGGTGLGTYVAALVIRVHNGRIGFSSGPAEGTTVTVELPLRQSELTDRQATAG